MTRTLLHVFALTLLLSTQLVALTRDAEWENVERIVAIGDIHGDYDNLVWVFRGIVNADSIRR